MAKDAVDTAIAEQKKIADAEEKKGIIAKIAELIRRTRMKLYETFIEIPDAHAIEKHLNKSESALKKLGELEDVSTATLVGLYEISEKVEAALSAGNLEQAAKELEGVDGTFHKAMQEVTNKVSIRYKNIDEAVRAIYDKNDNLKDLFSEDLLAKARVMMSEDGKHGFLVFPAEYDDKDSTERFDTVIRLTYDKNSKAGENNIKFDYLPDCEVNCQENGKYMLTNSKGKQIPVEFREDRDFANTISYGGELTNNIINCVATIEGVKARDKALENLKIKSPQMKIIEKYRKNNVLDEKTGCISTFEPDDKTFRIYDPDTQKLLVFYNKDKQTLSACVYNNVPSYDAPIYEQVVDNRESGIVTDFHYDTSKELYERTDILTLKEAEKGKTAMADMKLPYGDIDIQTMLSSDSVRDCLTTYGLKDFGINELMHLTDKSNVMTDKSPAKADPKQFLSLAQTVKDAMFASHIGVDGTINDKLDFEETHKVIYDEGGHTITVRTPSNAQMRLLTDASGRPQSIQYQPVGETSFYNVYNPESSKVMATAVQLKEWRNKDKEFMPCYDAINAAINVEINKGIDIGIQHSKNLETEREKAVRQQTHRQDKPSERLSVKAEKTERKTVDRE